MSNGFIQFQLWRECPNGCDFCYNKGLSDGNKRLMLHFAKERLSQDDIGRQYTCVGFIGGEFFSGQISEVESEFYDLINLCIKLIKHDKLQQIRITTGLMFKLPGDLYKVIDLFDREGLVDRLMICTSYDTKYRFQNENAVRLWKNNIVKLKNDYPQIKTHVEMIITEHLLRCVLNNELNLREFEQQYQTVVDFIEGQYYDTATKQQVEDKMPLLLPKRSTFLKFLRKIVEEQQYDISKMLNASLHSNLIYLEHEGQVVSLGDRVDSNDSMDRYFASIGREGFKMGYVDSPKVMAEDVSRYRDIVL